MFRLKATIRVLINISITLTIITVTTKLFFVNAFKKNGGKLVWCLFRVNCFASTGRRMIQNENNAGGRIRIRKEKGGFKTCTMLSWEEVNKLIGLIKNEGEVYHVGKVDLFEND